MDAPSFSDGYLNAVKVSAEGYGAPAATSFRFRAFTITAVAIRHRPLGGTSESPEEKVAYSVFQ